MLLGTPHPSHQSLDWLSLAQVLVPEVCVASPFPQTLGFRGVEKDRGLWKQLSPWGLCPVPPGLGAAGSNHVICIFSHLSNYHTPASRGIFTLPTLINIDDEGKSVGLSGEREGAGGCQARICKRCSDPSVVPGHLEVSRGGTGARTTEATQSHHPTRLRGGATVLG